MTQTIKPHIYVLGDNIIDHHIYNKIDPVTGNSTILQKIENGGAHLIYELLTNVKNEKITFSIDETPILESFEIKFGHKLVTQKVDSESNLKTETGLLWKPFRLSNDPKSPDFKKLHWRIDQKLGYGYTLSSSGNTKTFIFDDKITPKENDILIIDDGALEFRKAENKTIHEKLLKNSWRHIVYKISGPIDRGPLFSELISNHADKLTIIVSAQDLRKSNVKISKGISWEQAITDLVLELNNNKSFKNLTSCKSLIVTFSTEGAFYIQNDKNDITKYRLLFDPKLLERDFIEEQIEGEVFGYQSTFTSAVVLGLIALDNNPKAHKNAFEAMINNGLSATRALALHGHGNIKDPKPEFPSSIINKNFIDPENNYAFAFVPQPELVNISHFDKWTILKGNYSLEEKKVKEVPLFDDAIRFILDKKKGLNNVPQYSVNHFFTVDRREIEGLRNIKQLVLNYKKNKGERKPLSFAVFGSPGSGKSFIVKQIQKEINKNKDSFLEFNLSQFSNPNDIIGALHQVRDEVLDGKFPFVFWDEFDSKEYMWLQYLLAPMQDGKFQEGQITHNIGHCVFVFAGGTSYDFEHFGHKETTKPDIKDFVDLENFKIKLDEYKDKNKKFEDFKLKKGPDFKSRLDGYLNVLGPNQEYKFNDDTGKWDQLDSNDVFFPIRRAILFNALSGFDPSKGEFDKSLMLALLKVEKYTHGARSFEKTIKSIFSNNNGKMLKSNMPPETILNSHVNKQSFMQLLEESNELEIDANKAAAEVHKYWKNKGDNEGWKLEYHRSFESLPAHIKRDNVAAVLRIPTILKHAGYAITDNPFEDNCDDYKNELQTNAKLLNELAIIEHEKWKEFKEKNVWEPGVRNDDKKIHNCLVSFDQLSAKDQKKDVDAVKNIPDVLSKVGLFVKKI